MIASASVLRRVPAAMLAAALAVALPVVMVGPENASARPRPVPTSLDSHTMTPMSAA